MDKKKGKSMHRATGIMVMHPKWLHPNKASWMLDVTTQPPNSLSASSVAKPRIRKVITSIKYKSKQASIDMQIKMIQTL